jgi:hypothetical protein
LLRSRGYGEKALGAVLNLLLVPQRQEYEASREGPCQKQAETPEAGAGPAH